MISRVDEQMAMLPGVYERIGAKRIAFVTDGTQYAIEAEAVAKGHAEFARADIAAREEFSSDT